jgi:hypothetical protein
MCKLAYSAIGGFAIVLAMAFVVPPVEGGLLAFTQAVMQSDSGAPVAVNRSGKGDRLAAARTGNNAVITSVEVVGIRDAAIVYRDRDGRVLYQTDPLSNATVVAKDVLLPDVTIRSSNQSPVRPVPIENSPVPPVPQAKEAPKIPVGCDPAFSPLAAAAGKYNFSSRCLAEAAAPFATAMALPIQIE